MRTATIVAAFGAALTWCGTAQETRGAAESAPASRGAETRPEKKDDPLPGLVGALPWRGIGPAVCGGRIGDIAVDPTRPSTWYVAVASGGVWKTTNAGTTFEPIFDDHVSYSIGCVAVAPSHPLHVWVGTGENNSQRSVGYGDGVYKSVDGGKSFAKVGLGDSEHVGKILIHPTDPSVVYVAAQGPLWKSGGDRGLYRTLDGGATWERTLFVSDDTGVSEVHFDPRDPRTMYAVAYQRRRHVWTLHDGGPESGIYKSTDGGATWTELKRGLPSVHMGRIGMAIPPGDGDRLYAIVEAQDGQSGTYVSTDAGASFEKRSGYVSTSPQYYQELVCDPHDVDRVYSLDTYLQVTEDGGRTWRGAGESDKHVDNHALIVDPTNPDRLLIGCDGGIYESFDRARTWRFLNHLSIAQFYRVCVDDASPFFNVYGGTQDNNTLGGPSRTVSASGIVNSDWFVTVGGDGFVSRVEPGNPDVVYSQWQHGGLIRFDRRTGEALDIKPRAGKGDEGLRWNWDSPLIISPHEKKRLYFAAQVLYRSDDRGDSWRKVSGDLSRRLDRDTLQVMGRWWSIDAVAKHNSTSIYGNIVALDESPLVEGLLYVGTDDGLIQVSEDGGANWRRIEAFPGVPDLTYVTAVVASRFEKDVVYATFGNHKMGDFKPYVLKSSDRGRTWTSIASDLPARGNVWCLAQDHVKADLLFVGTEFGVYATLDGGGRWMRLGGGLPPIPVRDIAVQRRDDALVLATFGRGFYVMDDYAPLRTFSAEWAAAKSATLPTRDAPLFVASRPLGGGGRGFQGATYFTAPNPEFGATFSVWLNEEFPAPRAERRKAEKKLETDTKPVSRPTFAELRAEERHEGAQILVEIGDAAGNVVRRLRRPASKGLQRIVWDLREAGASPVLDGGDSDGRGFLVAPGTYAVRAFLKRGGAADDGAREPLGEPRTFKVYRLRDGALAAQDAGVLAEHRARTVRILRAAEAAEARRDELVRQAAAMRRAARTAPRPDVKLEAALRDFELRLADLGFELNGDPLPDSRNFAPTPSIMDRIRETGGAFGGSTYGPTKADRDEYALAADAFEVWLTSLQLAEAEARRLAAALDATGAVWTPGRPIDWKR
jgi:photosystem II stability/assembly factor-like uncharacterized protein